MRPMRWLLIWPAILLAGCDGGNCPRLPGGVDYCLQAPDSGPTFSALQEVVLEFNGQQEILLALIENDTQRMALVGTTPMGQTMLTVTWDGQRAQAIWPAGANPPIKPAALIALMQLAYWPAGAIRRGLPHQAVWVEDGNRRHLSSDGRASIEIDRIGTQVPFDAIAISLPAARLRLRITTLPEETAASSESRP